MLVTMIAKIMGEDHASRGEKSEALLAELGSSVFPERSLIKIGIFTILVCSKEALSSRTIYMKHSPES
jgi:hypothetical protein